MYRIVEMENARAYREIAQFDSAYAALDVLRREVLSANDNASKWRLLDPAGTVLVESADVLETCS